MIPDNLLNDLQDKILECLTNQGATGNNDMRVRVASYSGVKDIGDFCSISICPYEHDQFFLVDIQKLSSVFNKVHSLLFGNYQQTDQGFRAAPYFRLMADYEGYLFMLDVYLKPVQLDR